MIASSSLRIRKARGILPLVRSFPTTRTNLSGIAVGFGGVWLCSTPNLLYIPLKPNGDEPAGPPVVVLNGWDLKAKHNVFNQLVWGPDGWLYGCNGILSNSRVGKPGTPDAERVAFNCGVWRYHPIKKRFEVVASGTTNPWGLDFDDRGEAFITNCVIKHLFHVIPGAHYVRMYGEDLDPNSYGLMPSCADHIHWAGGSWTSSRGGLGAHSEAGGGHAHAGAMIYLGDNWPDAYRGHIFMCNLHGNRVNHDILERVGSGYVAHHGKDFLFGNNPWFRGLVSAVRPRRRRLRQRLVRHRRMPQLQQHHADHGPHLQSDLRPADARGSGRGEAKRRTARSIAAAQERMVGAPRAPAAAGASERRQTG